jgi:predicted Fe-Mo cluster-binding NifX family protein
MKSKKTGHILLILVLLGGCFSLSGQEPKPVKIAVASEGETIDSQVSSQGARCSWLLFFDEKGERIEAMENPYRRERGSAGVNCAQLLAGKGATVFVAGQIGTKMAAALEEDDIAFVSFSGSVKDAIAHILEKVPHPEFQPETVSLLPEFVPAPAGQDGGF